MPKMYLVSNEELNTLVRRRRLDALNWFREALSGYSEEATTDFINDYDMQLVEGVLDQIEQQVRADNIGYDYHEKDVSPITEDAFAALDADDGEDDTALDFALAHVDEDDTLRLLDVAADDVADEDGVEVLSAEPDESTTVEGVYVGDDYPAFPSQHTEVTQYTAEDEPEVDQDAGAEAEQLVVPPPAPDEGDIKRNAAAQRLLNREISQIDRG